MIGNFAELRDEARKRSGFTVAVPGAVDLESLKTVVEARREGLADAVLVGEKKKVRLGLERVGGDPSDFQFIDEEDPDGCAFSAVELARSGRCGMILKGHLSSATILRAALDKEKGIRTGRLISDVRLQDHPFKERGFLAVTDGGVIPAPTREQKISILKNALSVYHCLGIDRPKVAVICATENVIPSMPHTQDAAFLKQLVKDGEITGCDLDGPLSLDLAIIRKSAQIKGYTSSVAGEADILLMPSIETGNCVGKALVYFLGAVPGQVIMGGLVPLLIPSRSDSARVKLNSIALASLLMK